MSGTEDIEFERRIVTKVPEYMPELREELMKYPQNVRSKRLLQLAYAQVIGATALQLGGVSGADATPSPAAASKPAQTKQATRPAITPKPTEGSDSSKSAPAPAKEIQTGEALNQAVETANPSLVSEEAPAPEAVVVPRKRKGPGWQQSMLPE